MLDSDSNAVYCKVTNWWERSNDTFTLGLTAAVVGYTLLSHSSPHAGLIPSLPLITRIHEQHSSCSPKRVGHVCAIEITALVGTAVHFSCWPPIPHQ